MPMPNHPSLIYSSNAISTQESLFSCVKYSVAKTILYCCTLFPTKKSDDKLLCTKYTIASIYIYTVCTQIQV